MPTAGYNYELPDKSIAQQPLATRSAARMLVSLDPSAGPLHRHVRDLPGFVRRGDVVVVNETRVLPARLALAKETGGAAEVFLLEPRPDAGPDAWEALVRPGRRLPAGTTLIAPDGVVVAVVGERLDRTGRRLVRLLAPAQTYGHVPLPPYITESLEDPERYQTVYARRPGSVAAPTAGLHLTHELLAQLRAAGADIHTVDLAVGLGTFRPILTDDVADHVMHEERYSVPAETLAACRDAERVIAVGTTSVRALESAARTGELCGRTDLFIRPGFDFELVDVLLTNFHLPRSSLLVLLAAFVGDRWRPLYEEALAQGYRFLSFGDAMLVSRHGAGGEE